MRISPKVVRISGMHLTARWITRRWVRVIPSKVVGFFNGFFIFQAKNSLVAGAPFKGSSVNAPLCSLPHPYRAKIVAHRLNDEPLGFQFCKIFPHSISTNICRLSGDPFAKKDITVIVTVKLPFQFNIYSAWTGL